MGFPPDFRRLGSTPNEVRHIPPVFGYLKAWKDANPNEDKLLLFYPGYAIKDGSPVEMPRELYAPLEFAPFALESLFLINRRKTGGFHGNQSHTGQTFYESPRAGQTFYESPDGEWVCEG
jgi:hypothetical protein